MIFLASLKTRGLVESSNELWILMINLIFYIDLTLIFQISSNVSIIYVEIVLQILLVDMRMDVNVRLLYCILLVEIEYPKMDI